MLDFNEKQVLRLPKVAKHKNNGMDKEQLQFKL